MSHRAVSIAVFLVLGAVGLGLEAWARRGPVARAGGFPAAGPALAAAMRSTPGRVAVFSWWVWLGVHFLAR
jgi:hypothetical protein